MPRWVLTKVATGYRRLPPARRKRAIVASALVVLALPVAGYFWYDSAMAMGASALESVTLRWKAFFVEEKEEVEFVANRASRLYIDGDLVSEEIPPPYRVKLSVGEHTVRFRGLDGSNHELTIDVVAGRRERWSMVFADGEVLRLPMAD